MNERVKRIGLQKAAEIVRSRILELREGEFIGSEDSLLALLGCSRGTVRQVARLLEREGLLKVRRGIKGGYYGARPDPGTIEQMVGVHLQTLEISASEVTIMANALWIEAMRLAAAAEPAIVGKTCDMLRKKVNLISDDADILKVREMEFYIQQQIFSLSTAKYIKLIYDINNHLYDSQFDYAAAAEASNEDHQVFVRAWRVAKLMELNAIAEGDGDLAESAGRYGRKIWDRRVLALLQRPHTAKGKPAPGPA
jgi:GntR family transcriptional repressor for pyruvate dehydrogenase complex